jgi:HEAT repeat protein
MTLERHLRDLSESDGPVSAASLAGLSDLQGNEVEAIRQEWPSIPTERRREVVRRLIELAEDSFELDFEAVFRVALEDRDPEVRVASLEGLWESENSSLVPIFVSLLQHDEDEQVRAAAAQALGKFVLLAEFDKLPPRTTARMEAALLATLDAPETPLLVRRRALEAIAPRSHQSIPARIEAAYHSPEPDEQLSAIFAMGRTSDPRWLVALIEELQSDDSERRYEAAVACGEIEDGRAVPALRRALSDDDRDVQLAAISALGHIGGREARQALTALIELSDEQLQEAAEEALEEMSVSDEPFSFGISRS